MSIKQILVIDVEATCWEKDQPTGFAGRSEVIEIGVTPIRLTTDAYELDETESILIKPQWSEVSEFCTELTTLTQDMLDTDGVVFKHAMDRLAGKYKARDAIFASWGDYDRKIIQTNCEYHRVRNPIGNLNLNVKALFGAMYGERAGMPDAAKTVGVTVEGTHHRGGDDSRNIAKILLKLIG